MYPRIGITLDWQEQGTFSKRPHNALREHYFQAVSAAGGLPFGIPYAPDMVDDYLNNVDGLVIPGGFFASPNDWYVNPDASSPYEPSPRLDFDLTIIKGALDKDIPILGICAGMQLMGGVLGCKMTHDIQQHIDTKIDHLNEKPAEEKAHWVNVEQGTLLEKIVACDKFAVNTAHKEAIVEISADITTNAISEDGVIEGIELPQNRFAIGVQWHPEFFIEQGDPSFKLFQALIEACK